MQFETILGMTLHLLHPPPQWKLAKRHPCGRNGTCSRRTGPADGRFNSGRDIPAPDFGIGKREADLVAQTGFDGMQRRMVTINLDTHLVIRVIRAMLDMAVHLVRRDLTRLAPGVGGAGGHQINPSPIAVARKASFWPMKFLPR